MLVRKHLSVLGALALGVSALTWAPPAHADAHPSGSLWISGNKIVDGSYEADGVTLKARVLRGIHREGAQLPTATFPDSTELGWIGAAHPDSAHPSERRSWHASIVRIPVSSAHWTGACPNLAATPAPAAYQQALDDEISAITGQGVVALIDLHSSTAGCTGIGGHSMPDYDVTLQFWRSAASHYATNPLVAFELYNEPHFVTMDTWLNGSTGATVDDCDIVYPDHNAVQQALETKAHNDCEKSNPPKYRAIGMQQLADEVWTAAPNHLIVVDGPGRALTVPTMTLSDPHGEIAYAVHPYQCGDPDNCNALIKNHANNTVLNAWIPFGAQHPVLVTEFGWPVYGDKKSISYRDGATYYQETLNVLNQQSPAWGFVAFAFDNSTFGAYDLVTNRTDYAPNTTGQPVYDLLNQS